MPLPVRPLNNRPLPAGPASLVIPFAHPEPHGELEFRDFSYPAGFQTKLQNGDFVEIPTGIPLRSLSTANGYILGTMNRYHRLFVIYAEYQGTLHRFKIPIKEGIPVLLHPTEVEEFNDFRVYEITGKKSVVRPRNI